MLSYYSQLGLRSLRRSPLLSSLMILAIALGISASVSVATVNHLMSSNPIPHKSEQLYYVQLDSWSPFEPAREPNEPPDQITWTDALNLMEASAGLRQSAMASSGAVLEPSDPDQNPFMVSLRLNFSDFFALFDTPFLYGSGWQREDDEQRAYVAVITRAMNDRLFGGENSVGETITLAGKPFRVVGVLDTWQPVPKFYDVTVGAFNTAEDVFIPFYMKQQLELSNGGNTNCWKSPDGEGFEAFLNSECVNYQFWVELPTEGDKAAYINFLNSYVEQQKQLGRFERPLNNRLSNVMQWLENEEVVADDAQIMLYMAFMFLFVCLVNTVGLLLAKFAGKTPEIALRRAVGASRKDIFIQHMIESACIGILGGLLGLLMTLGGLEAIKQLYGDYMQNLVKLDLTMIAFAIILSLLSSLLAGLYPTWRACAVQPASQLKL
ncbi:ABC transporter permease [Alteromonas oceanisediminis]|uniref:ABC transporter permease n=1 Tax=Alteromonas oceanisediminis TaxID=2836180 RepID=UPI001BDA6912|nr:ABC transporter permease [Alteromonas oceanisediminis]MBT0587155.1 ABC transporter permease [Alteromonas oceanisediminis]